MIGTDILLLSGSLILESQRRLKGSLPLIKRLKVASGTIKWLTLLQKSLNANFRKAAVKYLGSTVNGQVTDKVSYPF